jgi:uncharacterized membrane protein YidH (DUF202 family)
MDLGHHAEGDQQAPRERSSVDVRQQLAADRTLLAWIRTSIALAGLGFVVSKFNLFLHEIRGTPTSSALAARALGLALVAAGAGAVLLGLIQHRQVARILFGRWRSNAGAQVAGRGGGGWSTARPDGARRLSGVRSALTELLPPPRIG